MKSMKESKWYGYSYRVFNTDGSYDLVLQVKECFEDPFGRRDLRPLRIAYRSIFVVDLDTGIIVKDIRAKRVNKKATPFELELFNNMKEKIERAQGAGI